MRRAGASKMAETVTLASITMPAVMIVMIGCLHIFCFYIFKVDQADVLPVVLVEVFSLMYPVGSLAVVWVTWRAFARE